MSFMFTNCSEHWAYIFTHTGFNIQITLPNYRIIKLQKTFKTSKALTETAQKKSIKSLLLYFKITPS